MSGFVFAFFFFFSFAIWIANWNCIRSYHDDHESFLFFCWGLWFNPKKEYQTVLWTVWVYIVEPLLWHFILNGRGHHHFLSVDYNNSQTVYVCCISGLLNWNLFLITLVALIEFLLFVFVSSRFLRVHLIYTNYVLEILGSASCKIFFFSFFVFSFFICLRTRIPIFYKSIYSFQFFIIAHFDISAFFSNFIFIFV